ncbi:MAG: hypothetical protein U9R69_03220 [Thermodesulfobacteriota bacterium]|nr:hypothetical protein [Thermodesulfobacteriota bacterium]
MPKNWFIRLVLQGFLHLRLGECSLNTGAFQPKDIVTRHHFPATLFPPEDVFSPVLTDLTEPLCTESA